MFILIYSIGKKKLKNDGYQSGITAAAGQCAIYIIL